MFNSYKSFIPKISTLFVIVLLFWAGYVISALLLVLLGLADILVVNGSPTEQSISLIIMYALSFGLPMWFGLNRSRKSAKKPENPIVFADAPDYGKRGALIWWVGSIIAGSVLVLVALWITSFIPRNATMGTYSTVMGELVLTTFDMIVAELLFAPIFSTWLVCAVCVRGLTNNGFGIVLSLIAAFIAMFLINLDYATVAVGLVDVACVGYIYYKTHAMKLAYVTMLVMCGFECLNGIIHFLY